MGIVEMASHDAPRRNEVWLFDCGYAEKVRPVRAAMIFSALFVVLKVRIAASEQDLEAPQ